MADAALPPPDARRERHKRLAVGLVAARVVMALVALPLTPALLDERFLLVIFLRPTREFLVLGGVLARRETISLLGLSLAAGPLLLLGVWVFFYLGHAWRHEVETETLPDVVQRYLPPELLAKIRHVLARRGAPLVYLARPAIFPTTILGAAAGASPMTWRRYLLVDTAGAVTAGALYVGLGWTLGESFSRAGPWITAAGVALLVVILWIGGRALRSAPETP